MDNGPQAQHKRKGSAVDMMDGYAPGSGKAARPSAGADEQQQREEEQEAQALTPACQLHLTQLRTSQEELLDKVDHITGEGGPGGQLAAGRGGRRRERRHGPPGAHASHFPPCCRQPPTAPLLPAPRLAAAVGLATLERLRANFQQRMAKVKQELGALVDHAESVLRVQSAATLDCQERAAMAGQLIGKLNIKTLDAQQQELFSAQEEPAAAE
jgi:hypothetical protein